MVEIIILIKLGIRGVPLIQKVDDIFDNLGENLFLSFELIFEFFLQSFVLTGEELVLLVQADTYFFELVLVGFDFLYFCFEGEIFVLGFERDYWRDFVSLL